MKKKTKKEWVEKWKSLLYRDRGRAAKIIREEKAKVVMKKVNEDILDGHGEESFDDCWNRVMGECAKTDAAIDQMWIRYIAAKTNQMLMEMLDKQKPKKKRKGKRG